LLTDQARRHPGIDKTARVLGFARTLHASQHIGRRFRHLLGAQFPVRHGGNFDLDVDPVEQEGR
jgi:hypothetical protein